MLNWSELCLWILISVLVITGGRARAEMPPQAYINMQTDAHEVLQIEVTKVEGTANHRPNEKSQFTVMAKVTCIVRSASAVTPSATIKITYETVLDRPPGWVGPSSIGILTEGIYIAYLDGSGGMYEPAAGGRSFVTVSETPSRWSIAKPCQSRSAPGSPLSTGPDTRP